MAGGVKLNVSNRLAMPSAERFIKSLESKAMITLQADLFVRMFTFFSFFLNEANIRIESDRHAQKNNNKDGTQHAVLRK